MLGSSTPSSSAVKARPVAVHLGNMRRGPLRLHQAVYKEYHNKARG